MSVQYLENAKQANEENTLVPTSIRIKISLVYVIYYYCVFESWINLQFM